MAQKIHVSPQSAPGQAKMGSSLGIHIEETVYLDIPGSGHESFVKDHVSLCKLCKMFMCPSCCLFVPLVSKNNKIEYYRDCGLCRCPYAVTLNGQKVGKVHRVKCCDNGCLFCMCPALTCGGKIKVLGMDGVGGTEKFIFAKSLFPCWPCVQACAVSCAPLGVCCVACDGCCQYCKGTEFKRITQPVYKGPWSRSSGVDPTKIGEFVITQRFNPICCCAAAPVPLRYYFKPTTQEGEQLAKEDLVTLALVLQIYRGMPAPCSLFQKAAADFQMPTGVCCLDVGLDTQTQWSTVQEVMRDSD